MIDLSAENLPVCTKYKHSTLAFISTTGKFVLSRHCDGISPKQSNEELEIASLEDSFAITCTESISV